MKCTKIVTVDDGTRDNSGKPKIYHRKCDRPAQEYTLSGELTSAKATLCVMHKDMAYRELARQSKGAKAKPVDPRQISLLEK